MAFLFIPLGVLLSGPETGTLKNIQTQVICVYAFVHTYIYIIFVHIYIYTHIHILSPKTPVPMGNQAHHGVPLLEVAHLCRSEAF